MVHSGRNYALFCILTLQAFGLLAQAIELYGTRTHLYRCLLLGDWVGVNGEGQVFVTDREVWSATWVNGEWLHN